MFSAFVQRANTEQSEVRRETRSERDIPVDDGEVGDVTSPRWTDTVELLLEEDGANDLDAKLVVEDDEGALAAGFGEGGDADGVDEIEVGVGAEGGPRAHGADDHDGFVGAYGEVEEVGGLLEGAGAVGDDEAVYLGLLGQDRLDSFGEGEDIGGADVSRADVAELLMGDCGERVDLGDVGEHLRDGESTGLVA